MPRTRQNARYAALLSKTLAAVALLAGLAGAAPTASAQLGSISAPLTAAERARLDRGAFVERRTEHRRGSLRLVGGSSFQVIRRPPEEVWRALTDFDALSNLLPNVRSTDVVERAGNGTTVKIRHKQGMVEAAYHIRVRYSNESTVIFQLDPRRKNDIHAGWGFVRIHPWNGNGSTLVSYSVLVDVGPGLVKLVLTPTFKQWVLRVPLTMKWYLEGRGKTRYRS